ncbi:hypothetical protein BaRGS_00013942 [Batillaria attramentaria]|uniref:Uncharacterized protein n=1 Tax=Batillaria attramentaria TaxID=370345 RepID=A0ABD0L6P3_9CAEN
MTKIFACRQEQTNSYFALVVDYIQAFGRHVDTGFTFEVNKRGEELQCHVGKCVSDSCGRLISGLYCALLTTPPVISALLALSSHEDTRLARSNPHAYTRDILCIDAIHTYAHAVYRE